jgi:hypothetical protein
MALVVKDRVKQQTTTTGTGTLTLSGSYTGFDTFSQIGDGNTTYYVITDDVTGDWEVGLGTYTAAGTTLSRDTILASSNAGAAIDLAAGTKVVFCGYPAEKSVYLDDSGNLGISGTVSATAFTGATVTATSNIHTPSISATTISATNMTASGNVNANVVSATTLLRSGSQVVAPIVSATIIRAASEMIAPTVSATRVVTTSITTDVVSATNVYATSFIQNGTALAPPGRVLLLNNEWSTGTPSQVTFEDTDGMDWSTYEYFEIDFGGYITNSCRIICTFSQSGVYQTGGTDYTYGNTGISFTASLANGTSAINIPNSGNEIYKGGVQYNEQFHLRATLHPIISDGTNILGPFLHWSFNANRTTSGNRGHANGSGAMRNLDATPIDGIKLALSVGTMNEGWFRVWGIR